ncbi:EF-hand calcium-binding domain-containing protein 3 isoform X1 [Esox lucius]|uniref:EF-hand domain-containing protein n=1 Tax=Esox lucius TaxID=8010 RepID=A0AAY5JVF3_ESOLU|nr:EF-hand calcium-binding domain-containing protein 3 isoform X1 [Esox lucius]
MDPNRTTSDLEKVLDSLCIDPLEDLTTMGAEDPLSDAQVKAFQDVFEMFASYNPSCIDAVGLSSLLDTVNMSLSPEQMEAALQSADCNGDGEVGFQDFLCVLTDCQKFARCITVAESPDQSQCMDDSDSVFYKAFVQILDDGLISSSAAEEIVLYYQKKSLCHVFRTVPQQDRSGGHVITYYAKGAHLVGLQPKQLMKYIESCAPSVSPYSKRPSLSIQSKIKLGRCVTKRPPLTSKDLAKSWKTVETEQQIRQLSIKYPGKETKDMITPVKVNVDLQVKDMERLTYDTINQIRRKSKEGLSSYLEMLSLYKQRDAWVSWGLLQCYHSPLECSAMADTFSTYTWSWSACRNLLHPSTYESRDATRPSCPTNIME